MIVYIFFFARKRCLELLNVTNSNNNICWLVVEVKQNQTLNQMYFFSWEGNEIAEVLSRGSLESQDYTMFKMFYGSFNSGSSSHPKP